MAGSPSLGGRQGSNRRAFSRQRTSAERDRAHKTYLEIDQEHASALTAFKARIVESGLQIPQELIINGDVDATLYRFLRARKYDVHLAFAMLEKSIQWRRTKGADTILEHPIDAKVAQVVRQCRPSSYIGFNREHHPIFVERLGKLDGKRMEREHVADDIILAYHLREMEFMAQVVLPEASAAAGHTVDRIVSVMDAAGLSLAALTGFAQRLFRLITVMDSDNYPECCHAIYIVNAGAAFSAIWRLLSPFVDKGTRDKVHVLGNAKASQQALLDAFGPDLVPTFLGGRMDYDAVRQQWTEKMDAAIAQRHQNPPGKQGSVVLQAPNGLPTHHPQRSSSSGAPRLNLPAGDRTSSATGGERMSSAGLSSASEDGWATPMSNASRMSNWSTTSGNSVYFDANSFLEEPHLPSRGSPADSDHGVPVGGTSTPYSSHSHPHTPEGAGVAGPGSVLSGSMSVGPQSRTRSQLSQQSGLTGFGVQGGLGGVDGAHGQGVGDSAAGSTGQVLLEDGEEELGPGKQPLCGCRCTIS